MVVNAGSPTKDSGLNVPLRSPSMLDRTASALSMMRPSDVVYQTFQKLRPGERSVTSHMLGKVAPGCWAHIIAIKRSIPRWLNFPILYALVLLVNCIWVLPVALTYLYGTSTLVAQPYCFSWSAYPPDYSLWYNRSLNLNNTNCLTGAAGKMLSSPAITNMIPAELGKDEQFSASLGCLDPPPGDTMDAYWANTVLEQVNQQVLKQIQDSDAQAFMRYNTPSLANLAGAMFISPNGNFNPTDGRISMVAQFNIYVPYPLYVPWAYDSPSNRSVASFKVQWFATCNGITKSCDSTSPCHLIIDCSTPITPVNGWSTYLYPFDKYNFFLDVNAWAIVTPLQGKGPSFQIAIPLYLKFAELNSAFKYRLINDLKTLQQYLFFNGQYQAQYVYPSVYNNNIPNILYVQHLYEVYRAPIIITWAMFIFCMMWTISITMFITSWDYVFLRPRDIPAAVHAASVAMIFSLPLTRNSMPGIPPLGIVMDVGGFFWNEMMVLSSSVVLLCGNWGQYRYGDELRSKLKKKDNSDDIATVGIVTSAAAAIVAAEVATPRTPTYSTIQTTNGAAVLSQK